MATVSGKPEDHHRGTESPRRGTPKRSPLPVGFAEERIDHRGTEGTEDGHTKRVSPCREEMPKCVGGPPPVCPPLRPPRPPRFNRSSAEPTGRGLLVGVPLLGVSVPLWSILTTGICRAEEPDACAS